MQGLARNFGRGQLGHMHRRGLDRPGIIPPDRMQPGLPLVGRAGAQFKQDAPPAALEHIAPAQQRAAPRNIVEAEIMRGEHRQHPANRGVILAQIARQIADIAAFAFAQAVKRAEQLLGDRLRRGIGLQPDFFAGKACPAPHPGCLAAGAQARQRLAQAQRRRHPSNGIMLDPPCGKVLRRGNRQTQHKLVFVARQNPLKISQIGFRTDQRGHYRRLVHQRRPDLRVAIDPQFGKEPGRSFTRHMRQGEAQRLAYRTIGIIGQPLQPDGKARVPIEALGEQKSQLAAQEQAIVARQRARLVGQRMQSPLEHGGERYQREFDQAGDRIDLRPGVFLWIERDPPRVAHRNIDPEARKARATGLGHLAQAAMRGLADPAVPAPAAGAHHQLGQIAAQQGRGWIDFPSAQPGDNQIAAAIKPIGQRPFTLADPAAMSLDHGIGIEKPVKRLGVTFKLAWIGAKPGGKVKDRRLTLRLTGGVEQADVERCGLFIEHLDRRKLGDGPADCRRRLGQGPRSLIRIRYSQQFIAQIGKGRAQLHRDVCLQRCGKGFISRIAPHNPASRQVAKRARALPSPTSSARMPGDISTWVKPAKPARRKARPCRFSVAPRMSLSIP